MAYFAPLLNLPLHHPFIVVKLAFLLSLTSMAKDQRKARLS
jgi:hypothetical protein